MTNERGIVERLRTGIIFGLEEDDGAALNELASQRVEAADEILRLRALVQHMSIRDHENIMASVAIGSWLSAALDDPNVCVEMKSDVRRWFSAGEPVAASNLWVETERLRAELATARDAALEEAAKIADARDLSIMSSTLVDVEAIRIAAEIRAIKGTSNAD